MKQKTALPPPRVPRRSGKPAREVLKRRPDVLRRLEERGLIGRKMSAEDSRAKLCTLTREGRKMAMAMEKAVRRAHGRTVALLPPAERKAFLGSLRRLVDAYNDLGRTWLRLK